MTVGLVMSSSSLVTILLSILLGLLCLGLLSLRLTEGHQQFLTTAALNHTGSPDTEGGSWSVQQEEDADAEFQAHYQRVRRSIRCGKPHPRLVYPEDLLPPGRKDLTTGVYFRPRATWAHRCQHDAGCCLQSDEVCKPSSQQPVEVVFKVILVQQDTETQVASQVQHVQSETYLRLAFSNHTACTCVPRNDVPRRRRRRRRRRR